MQEYRPIPHYGHLWVVLLRDHLMENNDSCTELLSRIGYQQSISNDPSLYSLELIVSFLTNDGSKIGQIMPIYPFAL